MIILLAMCGAALGVIGSFIGWEFRDFCLAFGIYMLGAITGWFVIGEKDA